MRVVLIIVGIIVVVISCGLSLRYSRFASHARADLEQERYLRMVAEENLQKVNARLETLETDLVRGQNKIKTMEKVAEQSQMINNDLKSRLDKISEINERLESKIRELQNLSSTGNMCGDLVAA